MSIKYVIVFNILFYSSYWFQVRVFSLKFSPTGEQWAAATTEGLLIYSLSFDMVFDPWDLQLQTTPQAIKKAINEDDHVNGNHFETIFL